MNGKAAANSCRDREAGLAVQGKSVRSVRSTLTFSYPDEPCRLQIQEQWKTPRTNLLPCRPCQTGYRPTRGVPYHVATVLEHDIGIRFNDKERSDVEEYCVSEGWVKVAAGKTLDRRGQPLLIKLKGKVEAFYR